jgi:H+/Cl- antiporter ClcA
MYLAVIENVSHTIEVVVGLFIIWLAGFVFWLKEYHPWTMHTSTGDKLFVGVLCFIWPICLIVLVLLGLYNLITYKRKS